MAPPRKSTSDLAARRMVYAPNHSLRARSPYLPEHRLVLWEKIGPGSHPCHWCGTPVDWQPGQRTRRGALITDHLDRDRFNNAPENLVPSCQRCNNRNTAKAVADGESHIVRRDGSRARAEHRTCETCGSGFLFVPADKRPNRGRFCSRPCARKAQGERGR